MAPDDAGTGGTESAAAATDTAHAARAPHGAATAGAACPMPDAYLEHGFVVFTAAYHLRRGVCCGSGCRHCPYHPPHTAGTTQVRP